MAFWLLFFIPLYYFGEVANEFPDTCRCWYYRINNLISPYSEFPLSSDGNTPIILIHGYRHDNSGWTPFRSALEEEKIGPVFAPNLLDPCGDIREMAHEIAAIVQYVHKKTGKPVILIGHSMGGLVAAYATQHLVPEGMIRASLSIGTPLKGTRLSRYGYGIAAFQMRHQNEFVNNLHIQMLYNPRTEYFCFGGARDPVIKPTSACLLRSSKQDPKHNTLFPDTGHAALLFDSEIIATLISVVKSLDNR